MYIFKKRTVNHNFFFFFLVARKLGYSIEYIPLYRDMSSRDLLQRRSTTPTGDTIWEVILIRFFFLLL